MSDTDPIENPELLPEPLGFLANEIAKMNEEYWLENRSDLIGAEEVKRDGFTKNQRRWLNRLASEINANRRRDNQK